MEEMAKGESFSENWYHEPIERIKEGKLIQKKGYEGQ